MGKKRIFSLLIFLSLLIPIVGWTQDNDTLTVNPGSVQMDGSFVEPYTNKWQVSLIDSTGTKSVIRIWTDYLQILKLGDKEYIHRVQDLYSADREWQQTWINVVEAATLIPLRFTIHDAKGNQTVMQFDEKKLMFKNRNEEGISDTTGNLGQLVYDWNLYGMLLVSLPLEIGTTYKLPFWSQRTDQIDHIIATVNERLSVKTLSGKSFSTHKISTNKRLTFWLTKDKPYVIKLQLDMPNGSTMIWEMI